jgi:hypothetical protein
MSQMQNINGEQHWFQNGQLHRGNDKPAIIAPACKKWYRNGKLHRDNDEPAVITPYLKEWYRDGKPHRDNGKPAVEHIYGDLQQWYRNGVLHRDNDEPAHVSLGCKKWYKNGLLHRENGPAVMYIVNNMNEFYINGIKIDRVQVDAISSNIVTITESKECSICLSEVEGKCCKTQCNHYFHLECFRELKKHSHSKCPNCRGSL